MLARHERSDTAIQHESFNAPDEVRRFPKGILTLVHLGSVTMGRAILEPGLSLVDVLESDPGHALVPTMMPPATPGNR
jgi:hypothetical protein